MKITADTITDEQIATLTDADCHDQDLGDYSGLRELTMFARRGHPSARRRCAEILNARSAK